MALIMTQDLYSRTKAFEGVSKVEFIENDFQLETSDTPRKGHKPIAQGIALGDNCERNNAPCKGKSIGF